MSKTILTTAQVADLCDTLTTRARAENSVYIYHFFLLKCFGLRVSEVLQQEHPYLDEYNRLHVYMPKVKSERIIYDMDDYELSFIQQAYELNHFSHINTRAIQREFTRLTPYRRLFCGDKPIATHLFRHNYAKQKFEQYNDFDRVHLEMGEKTEEMTLHYINSEIYYLS